MKPTRINRFATLTSSASSLVSSLFLVAIPAAHAASGTWSQLTSGGNWSNIANWSSGAGPIADGSGFTATFSLDLAASNTVKMDAPHILTALTFTDTVTPFLPWILDNNGSAANVLTLAGTTPSITVGTSSTATISAVLAGSTAWSKAGAGTLILSGDNSYTSATSIAAGRLNIQHANALGTTAGGTTSTVTGTLQLQGGVSFAAEALTLTPNSGSVVGLQNVSGDNTWNGTIGIAASANPARISSDAGTLTVAGNITAAGAQLVLQGASAISVSGKISGSSPVTSGTASSGAGSIRTLTNAANDFTGRLSITGGTLSTDSIKDVGVVSALGQPADAAVGTIICGTVNITGTLLYTGAAQSTDRPIQIGTNSTTPAVTDTGSAIIQADGASNAALTFSAANFNSQTNATIGTGANRTLTLQGSSTGANTIAGIIQDNLATTGTATVGITKASSGTWTLTGNNTYSGATSVNAGKLNIRHANALGGTTLGTTVANVGSLQLQGGVVFAAEALTLNANSSSTQNLQNVSGDNEWTGTITHVNVATANSVNIGSDAGLLTLSNTLSGAGAPYLFRGASAITVTGQITGASGVTSSSTGAGTRTLSNNTNNYGGLTTVSGGILSFSSIRNVSGGASALGAPADATFGTIAIGALGSSATLVYTGAAGDITDRVLNLAGTSGGATIDQSGASGNLKFTSALTATGVGSKTLTLQGLTSGTGEIGGAIVNNSTTGTTVSAAASTASTSLVLGSVDGLTVGNAITGTGITGGTTISAIVPSTKTVTLSATATVASGAVITSAGLVNLTSVTKAGAGSWNFSGVNTYGGNTTVDGGMLTLSNAAGAANANTGNDASTVTIAATGATLNLTYTGTDMVDKLFIGATQLAAGVYGAGNIVIPQITGTGTLTVASGPAPAGGYSSWASINGAGANLDDDHDLDGVSNGVEYFIGGPTLPTANTSGFTALPSVTDTGGILSVTWTKAAAYTGTYPTDFVVETSTTLAAGSWTTETLGVNVIITGNNVKYTFPAGTKNFARIKVTGP